MKENKQELTNVNEEDKDSNKENANDEDKDSIEDSGEKENDNKEIVIMNVLAGILTTVFSVYGIFIAVYSNVERLSNAVVILSQPPHACLCSIQNYVKEYPEKIQRKFQI